MTNRLYRALKAHRHLRGERVFCAGLRQVGWHALRHTFGSRLAQEGASPKAVQELMGHSDPTTTLRYMHLAPTHHVEAINLLDRSTGDPTARAS